MDVIRILDTSILYPFFCQCVQWGYHIQGSHFDRYELKRRS
jgi:hypothetical protein